MDALARNAYFIIGILFKSFRYFFFPNQHDNKRECVQNDYVSYIKFYGFSTRHTFV